MSRYTYFFLICISLICASIFIRCEQRHEADNENVNVNYPHLAPIILNSESELGLTAYQLDEKSFGTKTLSMIQSDSGVRLPVGSRGIKFIYLPPIDPSWAAKIEIPKESLPSMLDELSRIAGEKINILGEIGPRTDWWHTNKAKVLFDRQSSPTGNYLRTTLTAEDDSVILYIEWAIF